MFVVELREYGQGPEQTEACGVIGLCESSGGLLVAAAQAGYLVKVHPLEWLHGGEPSPEQRARFKEVMRKITESRASLN